jgi:hypothetical protein
MSKTLELSRSYADLFKSGRETDFTENLSWFDQTPYSFNQINIGGGLSDNRIDVNKFEQVFFADPISFGIYTKILDLMVLSDFEVYEVKRNGTLSLSRPAREYKSLLVNANLRERLRNGYCPAFWGTGLGDALTYKIRNGGKIEIKTEPFVMNGMRRIKVYGDKKSDNMEIMEYGVLNDMGQEIYRFKAKDVIHHRYTSPNASPYFSAAPGLVASKWLNLKYNILAAMDANFSGGMKASFLVGLDASKMEKQGASQTTIQNAMGKLKEDLSQGNGIRNKGRMVFTPFPLTWQNIQMNNSEQRVPEILPYIDDQIFYTYGVDPAILDKRNSKYDTADQARDDLYQSCQATFKMIEQDVEKGELTWLDPEFDNSRFIFRIPRQFSQEEIRIKEANDKASTIFFNNLKTANETYNGQGLVIIPTEDKLKSLEEQGMYFKTPAVEEVNIKPSSETQLADSFTQISQTDNVIRSEKKKDFWQETKTRLDKSFKSVLDFK